MIVAYLLTVTVTLLPAGRLADIWGRKRLTVIGMTVLVVSAVLCALAPTNVPPEHLSVANGFLSTARNFGQAIGAALAAALLAQGLGPAGSGEALAGAVGAQLGEHHLEAVLVAQQFAFRLAAALGLVGAVTSVLRGTEVPVAPLASEVERTKDGQEVGGACRAESGRGE